jgi:hypothetical protein
VSTSESLTAEASALASTADHKPFTSCYFLACADAVESFTA